MTKTKRTTIAVAGGTVVSDSKFGFLVEPEALLTWLGY